MFRSCLVIALAILFSTSLSAADKKTADRERRIRVIAAGVLAGAPPVTVAGLGGCRTDLSAAFNDAVKDTKPVVIFVMADCGGRGCGLDADVIAVKLDSYTGDGVADPQAQRILVFSPNSDGRSLTLRKSLPADATPEQIKAALDAVKPKATTAEDLDWFVQADPDNCTVQFVARCNDSAEDVDEALQPIQFTTRPVCTSPQCQASSTPLVATTDPRMLPPASIPQAMPGPTQSWTATSTGKGGFICRLRDRAKQAVETIQSHRPRLLGRGCGCR